MDEKDEPEVEVTEARDQSRYEIRMGGELVGLADYRLAENQIAFTHTEVNPKHGGQGLGTKLISFAVTDAREKGLQIDPICPFVRDWIEQNPVES